MNDALRDATVAFFGLACLAGLAHRKAHHVAVHDLRRTFHEGRLNVEVDPKGMFGMLAGQVSRTKVSGSGLKAGSLPFELHPGSGAGVNVRWFEFDLQDLELRNQPLREFWATFQDVRFDLDRALRRDIVYLRRAGEGSAEATLDARDLTIFLSRKYKQISDIEVKLTPGTAYVKGSSSLFGPKTVVEASGALHSQQGKYIVLVDASVFLNGKETLPAVRDTMLKSINPIVDVEEDLGLGRFVTVTDVQVENGLLRVRGKAHVPVAERK